MNRYSDGTWSPAQHAKGETFGAAYEVTPSTGRCTCFRGDGIMQRDQPCFRAVFINARCPKHGDL